MATQREAAAHLNSNEHQLRQLVRDGVLSGPGDRKRGGWDLDAARSEYIRYLQKRVAELDKALGTGGAIPEESADLRTKAEDKLAVERARKEAEVAESYAIKNAQLKQELVPIGAIAAYCEQVAMMIRAGLEALPGKCAVRIPHLRTAEVAMIKSEVSQLSDSIADFEPNHPGAAP